MINTCNSSAADGQRPSPLTGSQAALFEEIQGTIANLADQKKGGTCLCHIPRQGLATSRSQLSGERHHPHDSGAATWLGKNIACTYIYVHMYIYMYAYTQLLKRVCAYIHIYTHTYTCIYIYIYMYVCMYVCIYICKNMYVHVSTCTYVRMYV